MWFTMDYRMNHTLDDERILMASPYEVLDKLKIKDNALYEFCDDEDIEIKEIISFFW